MMEQITRKFLIAEETDEQKYFATTMLLYMPSICLHKKVRGLGMSSVEERNSFCYLNGGGAITKRKKAE